jgi:hypothetical protein
MGRIRSFTNDITGSSIERFSLAAGLIALTAVAATHVLATWSRYSHGPILASLQTSSVASPSVNTSPAPPRVIRPGNVDVDFSVTGAISRNILDPCTGKAK